MEWIALMIISAVLCSTIASSKGRSGGSWFLVGLMLGPLGLIAAIGVAKQEHGLPCRACRKPVDPEATICPHCRSADPIAPAVVKQLQEESARAERGRRHANRIVVALMVAVLVWVLIVMRCG